jgi:hypothetical protein
MTGARIGEILAMAAIVVLIALGGPALLVQLGHMKLLGALIMAGALIAALNALRTAYDPADPNARANASRAGAYVAAAGFALWAVLAPARWNFGACIVSAEVALVFDLIATLARWRVAKGN